MDKYEIGIRLKGHSKDYLKALSCEIHKKSGKTLEKRIIPHLTLLRPFEANQENELIDIFGNTLSKQSEPITYTINGFKTFKNREKVIYADIKYNPKIIGIINDLENSLEETIKFRHPRIQTPEDKNSINLHSTIIDKITDEEYPAIQEYFNQQQFQPITQPLFRIYLLKNKFILREYDFALNQNLERFDAINPLKFHETAREFENQTGLFLSHDLIIRNNFKF